MTMSSHAHAAVVKAKRDGVLSAQPCEECGSVENIEAHHDDYGAPLDVRWLCRSHHARHHAQFGSAPLAQGEDPVVGFKLDSGLLDALRRLAALGDRNVAQEIRRALRKHVDDAQQLEEAASA